MADWTRRERTQTFVEYVLRSPTNWVEIDKVLSALRGELAPERGELAPEGANSPRNARARNLFDDTVTVHAMDDEIVFRYEVTR